MYLFIYSLFIYSLIQFSWFKYFPKPYWIIFILKAVLVLLLALSHAEHTNHECGISVLGFSRQRTAGFSLDEALTIPLPMICSVGYCSGSKKSYRSWIPNELRTLWIAKGYVNPGLSSLPMAYSYKVKNKPVCSSKNDNLCPNSKQNYRWNREQAITRDWRNISPRGCLTNSLPPKEKLMQPHEAFILSVRMLWAFGEHLFYVLFPRIPSWTKWGLWLINCNNHVNISACDQ